MRLLLRLFWIAVFVAVLVLGWQFAAANAEPTAVSYVFGTLAPLPLWLVLLLAFAAGAAIATLVGFYKIAKLGLVARRYRKTVRGLESEVHELRNLPLSSEPQLDADPGEHLGAAPRDARGRGG
jgi:uncharacterized integral membrane protein